VDVLESTSRVRDQIVGRDVIRAASRLTGLMAAYREKQDLIAVGAYEEGGDPLLDRAVRFRAPLEALITQEMDETSEPEDVFRRILDLDRAVLEDA